MSGARDTSDTAPQRKPHHEPAAPSDWVERFAPLVPAGGAVLDLACGNGRHTRLFLDRGHPVTAVDIDLSAMTDLQDRADLELLEADLEDGRAFPLAGRTFAGIVVSNYLYRPLFPALLAVLAPGGVLIYETFARGNERFGRPRNPDHLLKPGELLDWLHGRLRVLAYEDLILERPFPRAVQRICARDEAESEA